MTKRAKLGVISLVLTGHSLIAAPIAAKRSQTLQETVTADYVTYASNGWTGFGSVTVNQFDPALGTLMGISYVFTDEQTITYFYNDTMATADQPFSIQLHHNVTSLALQFGTGQVTNVDGFVTGIGLSQPMTNTSKLSATGALPPLPYFVGAGTAPVDLEDNELAFDSLSGDNFADVRQTEDKVKLRLTYWYKPFPGRAAVNQGGDTDTREN
jgi:hypothetical protein